MFFINLGTIASINYKHDKLEYKLKHGIAVDVQRQKSAEVLISGNIQPELNLRLQRTGMKDVSDTVISESFESIKNLPGAGEEIQQTKLTQEDFNTRTKIGQQRGRLSGNKIADKVLSRIGLGVEAGTAAFGYAQGGIDFIAGQDIIEKAKSLKGKTITDEEYNTMMRNGRLRVAQEPLDLQVE